MAASFKKRVTKNKIYTTSEDAKRKIFNFIEMFYNPVKRHSHTGAGLLLSMKKSIFRGWKTSSDSWEVLFDDFHLLDLKSQTEYGH